MKDKKENIDNSLATARSPLRTYVERRVKLNDTFLKKQRPANKLRSIGDSEVPGLRIYIQPSGQMLRGRNLRCLVIGTGLTEHLFIYSTHGLV